MGVWSKGCQWNYNNVDPWYDRIAKVQSYCNNHWQCSVPITEVGLDQTCSTDTTSVTNFEYTEQYWCHDKGHYWCTKLLPSEKNDRYFSLCGSLWWRYTCISTFKCSLIYQSFCFVFLFLVLFFGFFFVCFSQL